MSTVLCFDTETTGFPRKSVPLIDPSQPRLVQLAWMLFDDGRCVEASSRIIRPDGYTIPDEVVAIHGINTELATRHGHTLADVIEDFARVFCPAQVVVAHNAAFDLRIVAIAAARAGRSMLLNTIRECEGASHLRCTMAENVKVVNALFDDGRPGKWPRLSETHAHYFGAPHESQHDALGDVQACARVYFEMERRKALVTT